MIEEISNKLTNALGTPVSIIVHTLLFGGIFLLVPLGFSLDQVMLILTTAVSLEAIYLSLFIQMSVNKTTASLKDVEEDIDEIQEDVEQLDDNFDEIQEDVEEISEDIEDIQEGSQTLKKDKINIHSHNISQQLTALQEEITHLRSEIKEFKK